MRKHTPEPVFGLIKSALGFRQFSLLKLEKCAASGAWRPDHGVELEANFVLAAAKEACQNRTKKRQRIIPSRRNIDEVLNLGQKEMMVMSYKIVRKEEATSYEAPGHYDVRPTRLHNPEDVNDGRVVMGLSHFLPGGGCEFGSNPLESIYYVIEGEMDVETEGGAKTTLHAGDSFHCGPSTKKGIQNNGPVSCQMLVVLLPSQNV